MQIELSDVIDGVKEKIFAKGQKKTGSKAIKHNTFLHLCVTAMDKKLKKTSKTILKKP